MENPRSAEGKMSSLKRKNLGDVFAAVDASVAAAMLVLLHQANGSTFETGNRGAVTFFAESSSIMTALLKCCSYGNAQALSPNFPRERTHRHLKGIGEVDLSQSLSSRHSR